MGEASLDNASMTFTGEKTDLTQDQDDQIAKFYEHIGKLQVIMSF
jgi:hypothetical protein